MSNRLADETSPYLRQHANNPVHWWPWSAAALAAARARDKPILLSIGYSACHWCHVMAHESFEDEATAQSMNEKFICIKVDREERPDIDKIYQLAQHVLTQRSGGWPLTMFLAADDLTPFYAGTYFPKVARYGMPPFAYVLEQVRSFWDQRRAAVREQNTTLREFLEHYGENEAIAGELNAAPIRAALAQIERNFDPLHGGHLGAPKFPHPTEMELLRDLAGVESSANLRSSRTEPSLDLIGSARRAEDGKPSESNDPVRFLATLSHPDLGLAFSRREKEKMVALTLTRMAEGGIHDQIGGGFCRYSVDERWEIPHFEKMLYDNAQLLPLYAQAARAAVSEPTRGEPAFVARQQRYRRTALDLVRWLQREMTSPQGAFYAALDADSEGEEGKFYVWQRDEVQALLSAAEFSAANLRYGFQRAPNFEHIAWNPIIAESTDSIAHHLDLTAHEVDTHLRKAREKMFAARAQRVHPDLDDKILTAWNALMIGGLARASRDLGSDDFLASAELALDFLHDHLWREQRLFACHAGGIAKFSGYLDDYAFLLDALLEMLATRWKDRDLAWAIALADALLDHFEDRQRGGFWFTANDHEALIQRPKPWTDEAIPSGNGVAARALLRLGHLTGASRYLDAAERTLRGAYLTMQASPQGCAALQRALNDYLHPRTHLVVRFATADDERTWRAAAQEQVDMRTESYFIPADAAGLPGALNAQKYISGGVAYLCRGTTCGPPILRPENLRQSGLA
jgi:uncharacterized protein